jgi:hypothetical protein
MMSYLFLTLLILLWLAGLDIEATINVPVVVDHML